jgi:hypothetical protein
MISQLETVRTATEIDARREEKLIMLGPVLERNEHEGLQPDINRIFQIMARRRLFPAPPAIMDGLPVKVEYIGPRAESFSIRSRVIHDKMYRFGNNPQHKDQTVFMQDAEFLLGLRTGDQPDFRMLTMSATMDTRDPAAALGQAIIA